MNRQKAFVWVVAVCAVFVLGTADRAEGQAGRRADVLDANTVGERELVSLPHMTADLARRVVGQRPFLRMAELDALLGQSLTMAQRTELYRRLFVQVNLNTATEAEILMIPGVGKRMLHEFLEYRPYRALAQFRREIGKYVDDRELARLEQYVFVPVDLNTATDADILTIPGLGRRMLDEFKEYRPYRNLAQFRREIGKYVDDKELERLARYVTVN